MDNLRYFASSKKWWKFDPKYIVLNKVANKNVLDVGCSYGDLGEKLKERNCKVDGVELYQPAVLEAKKVLNFVYEIDINNPDQVKTISNSYDVITFMDVLEHVVDPRKTLVEFSRHLDTSGIVIASIPNVLNVKERFNFLFGRFEYEDYGVLDKTHLRFYTVSSAIDLFQTVFKSVRVIGYTPRFNFLKPFVRLWPEMFALQIVLEGSLANE